MAEIYDFIPVKLGNIAEIISGVSYEPNDIASKGIRILRGGNIQEQNILLKEDDVFLPKNYYNANNTVRFGDTVLVASTGSVDVLGKAASCFTEISNIQIGAFLRIVRPKNIKFAYLISMFLRSKYFANYIKAQAKGTSINNIRTDYLQNFTLYIPKSSLELEALSNFIATLDKKIALNREINRNLAPAA